MKVRYNNLLPFPGFVAMAFFGVILARKKYKPLSSATIRHEEIHEAQAKECGGWIRYYLKYLFFWVKYGYRMIPFEREAYHNETRENYLDIREPFAWRKYS